MPLEVRSKESGCAQRLVGIYGLTRLVSAAGGVRRLRLRSASFRSSARGAVRAALIESGIGAFYLVAALMTAASAVMINAFLTGDYSIKYVAHYSDSVQPLFYKLTSYWGGLDGSIMFWVFLLSIFGSIAVYVNRERHRELIPYVVATISTVQMFFLFLMVVAQEPVHHVADWPRRPTARG